MYNALKQQWDSIPSLQAKKYFPQFQRFLEQGGDGSIKFIEENADFVETVLGGVDEVSATQASISKDREASENKKYFFAQALNLVNTIKSILRVKYDRLQAYCEQESIPCGQLTPETLLPATRRAVENGNWNADIRPVSETEGEDTAPAAEAAGSEEPTDDNPDPGTEAPAEGTEVETAAESEEATETETESAPEASTQASEDESPEADGSAEGDLRAKIASLNQDGLNKTEIWAEVKPAAEAAGWSRTAVWAYVDELNAN